MEPANTSFENFRTSGKAAFDNGEFAQAELIYSRAIDLRLFQGNNLATLYFNRSLCRNRQGDLQSALKYTSMAVKINEDYSKAWLAKSKLEEQLGLNSDAMESAVKACASDVTAQIPGIYEQLQKLLDRYIIIITASEKIEGQLIIYDELMDLYSEIINSETSETPSSEELSKFHQKPLAIWMNVKEFTLTNIMNQLKFEPKTTISQDINKQLNVSNIWELIRYISMVYNVLRLSFETQGERIIALCAKFVSYGYLQKSNFYSLMDSKCKIFVINNIHENIECLRAVYFNGQALKWTEFVLSIIEDKTSEDYIQALSIQLELFKMFERYKEAYEVLNGAIELAKKGNHSNLLPLLYNDRGEIASILGFENDVIDSWNLAINLMIQQGHNLGAADILFELAKHYIRQKDFSSAKAKAEKGYNLYKSPENNFIKTIILLDIEIISLESENYNQPGFKDRCNQAINLLNEISVYEKDAHIDKDDLHLYHILYGRVLFLTGKLEDCLKHFDIAEALAVEVGIPSSIAHVLVIEGEILAESGKLELAEEKLIRANEVIEQILKLKWDDELFINWEQAGRSYYQYANRKLQMNQIFLKKFDNALETAEAGRALAFKIERTRKQSLKLDNTSTSIKEITLKSSDYTILAKESEVLVAFYSSPSDQTRVCWVITPSASVLGSAEFIGDYLEETVNRAGSPDNLKHQIEANQFRSISNYWKNPRDKYFALNEPNSRTFGVSTTEDGESNHIEIDAVDKSMWKLIENKIPEKDVRLVLICDRDVWKVPFCSIRDSKEVFLVDRLKLSYSISMTSLFDTWDPPPQEEAIALLIGNPTVDLSFAETEILELEERFRKDSRWNCQKLLQDTVTKSVLIEHVQRCRLFHIAAHGVLEANGEKDDIYSGALVLHDRDTLSAREIQTLDLSRLELAFLHCCVTGRGRVVEEGLVGIARAFLFAGARAVVVSRGPVPENEHSLSLTKVCS